MFFNEKVLRNSVPSNLEVVNSWGFGWSPLIYHLIHSWSPLIYTFTTDVPYLTKIGILEGCVN